MERTTLAIEGMSCGHCARAVERALQALEGVEVERVEVGSARLAYDPARVGPEQIAAAVEAEGYTVRSRGRQP